MAEIKTEILQSTTDYDQFKQVIGNRAINETHLSHLITSIEKKNMLPQNPIIVNERMEVIDGQHRILAAKALGLPVYYSIVKGADLMEIQRLNSNLRPWLTEDYLESYIAQGKKEYMQIKAFAEEYRISLAIAIHILGGGKLSGKEAAVQFKSGGFVIKDYAKAEKLASLVSVVRDHSPDRASAHIYCVRALAELQERIDPKIFTEQLTRYGSIITRRVSTKDYLLEFENIIKAGGQSRDVSLI